MKKRKQRLQFLLTITFFVVLLLTSCQKNGGTSAGELPQITTTPEPTVQMTPEEEKTLVVCLGEEPQSLYLYGGSTQAMWSILEAIYDGPIDTVNYEPVPVILESLPSLENGGIVLQSVSVTEGDLVANIEGDPVALKKGVKVFPAGCTSSSCAVEWDGESELSVVQMTANFKLLSGIKWSDGEPLTAEDSVYSYEISADPATDASKGMINRTAEYTAVDQQTVRWTGIPGYLTQNASTLFWIPQPKHLLSALTAEELLTSELTTKKPLGWGAYQIDEWTAGDHIRLVKNPNYIKTGEDAPYFDVVVYRFLSSMPEADLSPIATGECDIMDPSTGLEGQIQSVRELELAGKLKSYFGQTSSWEGLNFGIKPATYDEVYNPYVDRQDIFGDVRTRQAFAYCIDREAIISDVLFSQSQIPSSYLPGTHPNAISDLQNIAHDSARGIQLLEEVGWLDADNNPETPRTALGVANVFNDTELSVNYYLTDTDLHRQVSEIVVNSLKECGVKVTVTNKTSAEMLASGPDGEVFGRNFDLVEFAWTSGNTPPCFLYSSSEIPNESNAWLGTKYGGVNISGYSNETYDAACSSMLTAGLDSELFDAGNQTTQQLIAEEVPVLPLFYHLKVMVSRPDLCGLTLDASSRSPLNSIESLTLAEGCSAN